MQAAGKPALFCAEQTAPTFDQGSQAEEGGRDATKLKIARVPPELARLLHTPAGKTHKNSKGEGRPEEGGKGYTEVAKTCA